MLTVEVVPLPTIAADEVLIRVAAAAINPVDYKVCGARARGVASRGEPACAQIVLGWFSFVQGILMEPLPCGVGLDASGTVVAVGERVTRFHAGDEVYTFGHFVRQGTLAEYYAVMESVVAKKPCRSRGARAAWPAAVVTVWPAQRR